MKKVTLFLLGGFLLPFIAYASPRANLSEIKAFKTPSGAIVQLKEEKFILPSGIEYIVQTILPMAKADELPTMEDIRNYFVKVSGEFGANPVELLSVASCESGFKIDAKGDYVNGKPMANGILQFWKKTFDTFKKESGIEGVYPEWRAEARLGAWAFSQGLQNHWFRCWKFYQTGQWQW